jgi:hypothetical protein
VTDRDITFVSDDVQLAGMLSVPDRGAHAGVVLVGGSGPSDRNNDAYFPLIRPSLVAAGIAVLSYDKRGVGDSSGDWRDATLDDLAGDAVSALDFLRAQGVDEVGLFGHSEGGWVVLRAAARTEPAWVVTNSCPGMTPAEQDRFGLANVLRKDGLSADDVVHALALYDAVVEAGRGGADFADLTAVVGKLGDPHGVCSDLDAPAWEFFKRKQDHDPLPDVRAVRCPLLAIYGTGDLLVPVSKSISLFSGVACEPDRDPRATFEVAVFPRASHRVQTETNELATGYVRTLVGWITSR